MMDTPEGLARFFHDTYERLASGFGYETRTETRHFDPESSNGRLMIAVAGEVLTTLQRERDELRGEVERLRARSDAGERVANSAVNDLYSAAALRCMSSDLRPCVPRERCPTCRFRVVLSEYSPGLGPYKDEMSWPKSRVMDRFDELKSAHNLAAFFRKENERLTAELAETKARLEAADDLAGAACAASGCCEHDEPCDDRAYLLEKLAAYRALSACAEQKPKKEGVG